MSRSPQPRHSEPSDERLSMSPLPDSDDHSYNGNNAIELSNELDRVAGETTREADEPSRTTPEMTQATGGAEQIGIENESAQEENNPVMGFPPTSKSNPFVITDDEDKDVEFIIVAHHAKPQQIKTEAEAPQPNDLENSGLEQGLTSNTLAGVQDDPAATNLIVQHDADMGALESQAIETSTASRGTPNLVVDVRQPHVDDGSPECDISKPPRDVESCLSPATPPAPKQLATKSSLFVPADEPGSPVQQHRMPLAAGVNSRVPNLELVASASKKAEHVGPVVGSQGPAHSKSSASIKDKLAAMWQGMAKQNPPGVAYSSASPTELTMTSPGLVADDDVAAAGYAAAKKAYERKKKRSQTSFLEDVEFLKLRSKEEQRVKRLKLERERCAEEEKMNQQITAKADIFANSKRLREIQDSSDDESESDSDDSDNGEARPSNRKPRKQAKPPKKAKTNISKQDLRESMMVGVETPRRTRKKKTESDGQAKQTSRQRKASSRKKEITGDRLLGSPKKANAKSDRAKPKPKPNKLLNVESLLGSNVVRDAAGNEKSRDLPTFEGGDKAAAYKSLVASLPEAQKEEGRQDKQILLAASRDFLGRRACTVDGKGGWLVKGMKTALKNYQMLGAAFMRRRELAEEEPRGGLCADGMGLGKTITMIANMVDGRQTEAKAGAPRTTLIVVPPDIIGQWQDEMMKHADARYIGTILTYAAGNKIRTNDDISALQQYDFVLTTYGEVRNSYPNAKAPEDVVGPTRVREWWEQYYEQHKGVLHRIKWYRVVLDEAQVIKSHHSQTHKACRSLMAIYRWAISGTPIQNSALELFAYFKFLKVPHTGDLKTFKSNYFGGKEEHLDRMHSQLSKFMLRRTHADKFFGVPILKLPKASEHLEMCSFNSFEKAVYDIVKKRIIARINRFSKTGGLQRSYSSVLTMLSLLRQICSHVLLVELALHDLLCRDDLEKLRRLADEEAKSNSYTDRGEQIVQMRRMLEVHAAENDEEFSVLPQISLEDDEGSAGRSHGMTYDFRKYLATLRDSDDWHEIITRTICAVCQQSPVDPMITNCYHIHCQECITQLQETAAQRDLDSAKCGECQAVFEKVEPVHDFEAVISSIQSSSEDDPDDDTSPRPPRNTRKARKRKNKDEVATVKNWIDLENRVLPSAKTIAIKAQILNWIAEKPGVKIIIFTQFLAMIRILAKICAMEKWSFGEYHGKMNFAAREGVIRDFDDPAQDMQILLASMKCGGVGLNLTMASRVICVDPWWNECAEQQAFCRVFRIGQVEETKMTRFAIEGTIDAEMIQMQKDKKEEIDEVMAENGTEKKSLKVEDLMRLFGPVREDDEGHPFIYADEDEDEVPLPIQDEGGRAYGWRPK